MAHGAAAERQEGECARVNRLWSETGRARRALQERRKCACTQRRCPNDACASGALLRGGAARRARRRRRWRGRRAGRARPPWRAAPPATQKREQPRRPAAPAPPRSTTTTTASPAARSARASGEPDAAARARSCRTRDPQRRANGPHCAAHTRESASRGAEREWL